MGTRLPHQSEWGAARSPAWADEAATALLPPVTDLDPAPLHPAAPVGARTAARQATRNGKRSASRSSVATSASESGPGLGSGSGSVPGDAPAPAPRPDTLRKLLPQALVVAFLAGGTVAFLAGDKDVRLTVDGEPRTLHTFAGDVEEVLEQQGVPVGEHDLVAPGRQAELHDGDEIVVRYGRPVSLTLDGHRRQLWTTAGTVDEALRELGVRAEGAHLSASRSSSIGRHGLDLDVRTERTVTFLADGRERTVRTNAATVREAVAQSGITLQNQDTTSVDPDSFPREGQTISVLRISGTEEVREEPVPFRTEKHKDATLFQGTEAVDIPGRAGVRRVTYAFRTVNGVKQRPKVTDSDIVKEPVTQVVRTGTKALPTTVAGTEGLNWQGLAHCEAGGRPNAVDPSGTYGGLYQFDTQTWHSLGGAGRPQDAPAGEQTFRAKRLYIQRGASPWPVCGRKLGG
ncbi:ubiquitin-like domain-containing protein [Streptomyces sp. H10-C2]|uniref:resuscitation-promoting factor n=1 Tax=unclassified Streptomyces TaxID=2593676 RepID=UPI0024B8C470|nr:MULTISPECIES: resuscitation-promoting factor [unclassified Streptomyces]MDJ0341364.1 ubiquitin-like domain-containing protein [Streptomyces sp. PH10-H1]MDJ0370959.1 ubiquitin-like domain-containing protein [Streptomyces sp. H10-C2]